MNLDPPPISKGYVPANSIHESDMHLQTSFRQFNLTITQNNIQNLNFCLNINVTVSGWLSG